MLIISLRLQHVSQLHAYVLEDLRYQMELEGERRVPGVVLMFWFSTVEYKRFELSPFEYLSTGSAFNE
jgi:hypothetical protein